MSGKGGNLTIVVGLPGSGKSRLMASLRESATGLVSDDFMKNVAPGSPVLRDPSVTDSRHYPELIRDLRQGKQCVISDIVFCDTLIRTELETAVRSDVKALQIRWEFFENNLSACEANARRRARKQTLTRELKLIRFLSRKYFVPEGVVARKVWNVKGRPIKRTSTD